MEFSLPKGMLLGVSTAAAQIEGGDVNSNWNDWYRQDGVDQALYDAYVAQEVYDIR